MVTPRSFLEGTDLIESYNPNERRFLEDLASAHWEHLKIKDLVEGENNFKRASILRWENGAPVLYHIFLPPWHSKNLRIVFSSPNCLKGAAVHEDHLRTPPYSPF